VTDIFTKSKRSEIMAQVKNKNTTPEIEVRKILHSMGCRFRLNDKKLPGTPDIVLPKHEKVIFVNGSFWHGHKDFNRATRPSSNSRFWRKKIESNMERDLKNIKTLKNAGWRVMVVWSCQIKDKVLLEKRLVKFLGK